MAEDEDGVSNKKSSQNSDNAGPSQENQQNDTKPDLGIEEAKYDSKENGESSSSEPVASTSKSTGAIRRDENPFSFRHFLKRDLSLPGNSTYENTGARPKVYANTVQHSPTKLDLPGDKRDKSRTNETQAKDKHSDGACPRSSDNTSSSSSVEILFSVMDNTDSKHNLYSEASEVPFYHRPNLASEPLGMPSLPDFVQDHILVEQAYLNSNGPISVDLDNLPDFTFNTSFNGGSPLPMGSRRNASGYGGNRGYDYESYMGAASTSAEGASGRSVPLDLPAGAEAAGPIPLDLPMHLNLDLTESVNPADRRNVSPHSTFPLDLPTNAGAEAMRLPDFLPVHPGRTSPEPEHQDEQLRQIMAELERTRSELFAERSRRSRAEEEAAAAREAGSLLRAEAAAARAGEAALRARLPDRDTHAHCAMHGDRDAPDGARSSENDATIARLRNEVRRLKEELAAAQGEVRSLRALQGAAARDLRAASAVADTSLRELLAGIERLRSLSSTLDPT